MNEAFLQFIWKMKLFTTTGIFTTDGDPITLIHNGDHNTHSGPDFTNARIKIGGTTWAGNVELHIRSSEWNEHKHSSDRAYDNVILHAVYIHDDEKSKMPTLVLKNLIDEKLIDTYKFMMQTAAWIPCEKSLHTVNEITIKQQLNRLLTERLEQKALNVENRLILNNQDWEETCYQLIARNFGTNINADPFEGVARSLPYKIILKHLNQPKQIEALLFGQAGFLEGSFRELYPHQLQAEYVFLKSKYRLEGIRPLEWKFLRMRPANFPTVRMSQLASFLSAHDRLFSAILSCVDSKSIKKIFQAEASAYWKEHYHFKKAAAVKSATLGKDTIDLILINTIAPLLFLYGKKTGNEQICVNAVDLLEHLEAENNTIIRQWERLGIKAKHAGDSQALLELKKNYCSNKRCLECSVGFTILKSGKI